jgi:hypothetical protein
MARFYFHVRDERGLIPDEEGGEYQGLAEALAEASASDLAKQYVDRRATPLDAWINVADESGAVLAALPLHDVFRQPDDSNSAERLFDAHMRADKALAVAKRVHLAIKQALAQERRDLDSREAAEDRRWREEERELTKAARSSNDR